MHPIVYFFLALIAVLVALANAGGPVVDINNKFIFHGSFYVLPVIRGRGGGVTLAGRGGKPCPLDIVQARSEVDNGIPVKFTNWESRVGFVPESADLNIEINDIAATSCVQSTHWWVGELDKVSKKRFVVAGPKPEEESLKSFFQIKKVENPNAYKFVFCSKKCTDVGIFVDEKGVRRLALSSQSQPFLVQFKKANVTRIHPRLCP